MHHVIIGTGPAGVSAAETLRRLNPGSKITMIGGEGEVPYSRMAIPYVLDGGIKEQGTHLRQDKGHYERLDIEVLAGPVTRIDAQHKLVELLGGSAVNYDKLLIAAGASPVKPPVPGLDLPGVHHCWTLGDMRVIEELAQSGEDVVLMGAGFIGSIILEALKKRGVNLTVVELGDRMVPRMLDETAGGLLKQWCIGHGVDVLTDTGIDRVEPDGERLSVHLTSGASLSARLLVVAAGVKPNTGFLTGSGIKVGRGIVVDAHQQTSLPDIYAAGDIVESHDISTGEVSVMAIQPVVVDHARVAATNMAGFKARYEGALAMNVLDTLGLITTSFGLWHGTGSGEQAMSLDAENYKYLRLEFDGDHLVGAQSLGLPEHVGVLRGLIQSRIDLGPWKQRLMANPHQLAAAYVACTNGVC
ncbi:MAG: hypothetical protein C0605_14510 [Hyphomicrobiales bacterium]|nr:MAG: hypothetical protein C0605_14510 [Hyphomicrobiales bacterium]